MELNKRELNEREVKSRETVIRMSDGRELKDPNSTSLNETSLPPMACCMRLCCKTIYFRTDERPGRLHFSDTQMYWCDATMDPHGPDDRFANPKVCQPGRLCYRGDD